MESTPIVRSNPAGRGSSRSETAVFRMFCMERYRSGLTGQTVNLLAYAFGGSNPPLSTIFARKGLCNPTAKHLPHDHRANIPARIPGRCLTGRCPAGLKATATAATITTGKHGRGVVSDAGRRRVALTMAGCTLRTAWEPRFGGLWLYEIIRLGA